MYFKFDPAAVNEQQLETLRTDSNLHIMDIPFAEAAIYDENLHFDSAKAAQLKDGNIYVVGKSESINTNNILNSIPALIIDTLVKPNEMDTALQFEAMRQAGFYPDIPTNTTDTLQTNSAAPTKGTNGLFNICLFKRPHGYVGYYDTETQKLEGVPGMQVWALVLGIPVSTYSRPNGYYEIPWLFSIGTIMGIKASNYRVHIRPLDTYGTFARNVYSIVNNFVTGPVYVSGWKSPCAMKGNIDFNFWSHTPERLWCHILKGVYLHDQYCLADNIPTAPSPLTAYAQWDETKGDASAPMLNYVTGLVVSSWVTSKFNEILQQPIIANTIKSALPDLTFAQSNVESNNYNSYSPFKHSYSAATMHTIFHELAHASHYRQVGNAFWTDVIKATLANKKEGYGDGNNSYDGNVAVTEGWAEFLATVHAKRLYPNGRKVSKWAMAEGISGGIIPFSVALEKETYYYEKWIPTGIYNDLMDVTNTDISENNWDKTGGLSIRQLYQAFDPTTKNPCLYQSSILQKYPQLSPSSVKDIFRLNYEKICN